MSFLPHPVVADVASTQNFVEITRWFRVGSGDPEGVEAAQLGAKYIDRDTGDEYRKAADDGEPTGWVPA